jgi:uncharacterized protein YndB with AHSA1/START domain
MCTNAANPRAETTAERELVLTRLIDAPREKLHDAPTSSPRWWRKSEMVASLDGLSGAKPIG